MDPLYNLQWHLNNDGLVNTLGYDLKKKFADIGAEAAWILANGGSGVKIALIDPDFSLHPDYTNNILDSNVTTGGALLLISSTPGILDRDKSKLISITTPTTLPSHGTAILGIVGAEKNSSGLQGIAYSGELIPIMMPINNSLDLLPTALRYATDPRTLYSSANLDHAADIINMSFGSNNNEALSKELNDALSWATLFGRKGRGNIIVWSVSNSYKKLKNDDALSQSKRIIKIGRSAANDQNNGSAYGPELELLAPGVDFLTLNENAQPFRRSRYGKPIAPGTISMPDNGFTTGSFGTSWAAPVVSGVIALMLQANPNLTWVEVKYILKKTALPIEIDNQITGYKWKDKTGNDIVDANRNLIPLSGNTILSNPITDPNDNAIRDVNITVQNASGFQVGQAIMIGARTKTTAAITSTTQIQVYDTSLFKQNHFITIGTAFSTTIFQTDYDPDSDSELNNLIPPDEVNVKSKSGFIVGQKVVLEGSNSDENTNFASVTQSNITIQSISGNSTRITLSADRTVDYNEQASLKVLGKQSGLKIASISGNTIILDTATPITDMAAHPEDTLVEIEGTEIVFISNVDLTNNILTVNKLQNSIPIPTAPATIPVIGGKIPFHSDHFGFGRVDAYQAIKEARQMFLSAAPYYDLFLRDNPADNGFAPSTTAINSPDIAVSHSSTFPSMSGSAISHVEPIANKTRFVHVQIQNIGSKACLGAELRLFLRVVTAGSTPSFNFPDDWNNYKNLKEIENSISPIGLYLFDEDIMQIPEGSIGTTAYSQFTFKWPKKFVPRRDVSYDTYLMAMISPFDGLSNGPLVSDNNNISYKPVNIIDNIIFRESIGGAILQKTLSLSAYSSPTTIPFAIEIENQTSFNFNTIELNFKQKKRKETDETVTFKNISGVWKFDGATPSWILFSSTPSTTSGTTTNFVGSYKVTPEQKYVEINVKVIDSTSSPAVDFSDTHRLKVSVTDVAEIEDTSKGGSKMHFYTNVDSSLVLQTASQAFGPFSDPAKPTKDLFRITNLHSATIDPKVYSICDGLVCAQEIDANLVNLIVKPFQQPAINFAPIKYIIYKGVKRSSLFSGNDIAPVATNSLTKTIWDSHLFLKASIDQKIADMTAAGAPAGSIPTPLPATPTKAALGLDLTAALDASKYGNDKAIENLFLKADANFQYPIIRGGWDIGDFDKTSFGIEIVFENIGYKPTLNKVRVLENIIELDKITGTETEIVKLENKLAHEEVLNYMDTAAFFGSMYSNRVFIITSLSANTNTNSFSQKNAKEIYDELIKLKFLNKNRTYIDIRNEHSYSFNFYSNYDNNIRIGFDGNSPINSINYYDNDYSWPLLIIDNAKFSSTLNSFAKKIEISLPVANIASGALIENEFPLAYISQGFNDIARGTILKGKNRFIEMNAQIENGTLISNYTKESIKLEVPNGSTNSTEVVPSYIRLKYLKRFDTNITNTPAPSTGIVLRAQSYLDNLFIPINMQIPYNSTNNLNSVVFDEEVYIDATNSDVNFDCIAKIGLAEDANNNVTLFAFATDVRIRNKDQASSRFAISGESNGQDIDYLAQLVNQNPGITASKDELTILGNAVPYVSLLDENSGNESFDKVDPDDFFSLVITKAQFDDIILIASDANNFAQNFKVYLAIANKTNGNDDNGLPYTQFDLVLRGHKLFSTDYQIVEVAVTPTITIYSNGNI